MKKSTRTLLLIALATPFLVQCASQSDLDDVRYQLRIVNKKLEDMKSNQVNQLQKRQAAATGQMDQFESEILAVKSQLEETYHLNQRLKEQNKELENSISTIAQNEAEQRAESLKRVEQQQREKEALILELNEKLQQQEDSVQAIQQARILEAERRAKEAALAAELAKTKNRTTASNLQSSGSIIQIKQTQKKVRRSVLTPKPAAGVAVNTSTSGTSSQSKKSSSSKTVAKQSGKSATASTPTADNMTKGQQLYSKGKYKDALSVFEAEAANSSAPSAVGARYMMAESLYQLKEYDKAIMQYQKIISQHANDSKAPASMLKQAMAFEKLSDKDTAKVIYKKLIKKHSSTPEAAQAQEKMAKL